MRHVPDDRQPAVHTRAGYGRWWSAFDGDGNLLAETSVEAEARVAMRGHPGATLYRQVRLVSTWLERQDA